MIGKPFGCAQCSTFWATLLYCLFVISFINALGIASLSALFVLLTDKLIQLTTRLINKIK